MTRARAAYLPIAIVFGVVAIAFLAAGNSVWVAFLPIAITFMILSQQKHDEDEGEDGEAPAAGPQPPR